MKYFAFVFVTLLCCIFTAFSQANFSTPDTVCVNQQINIINQSPTSNSYYWNFCLANTNMPPEGLNMGNIGGIFDGAVYMDYVQDNGNFYGFVTDNHAAKLYRLNFGISLLNTPTITDLGNVGGVIPLHTEGIQIVKNESKWYAIVVGGDPAAGVTSKIVKIEFGSNIANNSPVGTNWGNIGNLSYPHDLYLFSEGNRWYGVTVNYNNNSITRFDFTNSFSNIPTGTNLGNIGNLSGPTGVCAVKDNGNWYVFITNAISSTLSRLNFGTSLLNSPVPSNLGNIGGAFHIPWDIDIIKYCGSLVGFVINADQSYGDLIRLDFNNNLTSAPTAFSFGNIGNLKFPHCLSRIFRWESDLYTFIPNVDNHTLSRLKFPGCSSSNIPNSIQQHPPPITYNTPGTYNINLSIDDGLPSQSSFCRNVVVMPALTHTPTKSLSFCEGDSILLTSNFPSRNNWSSGSSANSIYVQAPGLYWVETANGACVNRDTFIVTVRAAPFQVNLGNDTLICNSDVLVLDAKNQGASYLWNTGATSQSISISTSGQYSVRVIANSCSRNDTIEVLSDNVSLEFQHKIDPCNPHVVQFSSLGVNSTNTLWEFGDGASTSNSLNASHTYPSFGSYNVTYTISGTRCTNSITKIITVGVLQDNIVLTPDTTICFGATKQLKSVRALNYCWSPAKYLDNPNSQNPITSTIENITYYLTAETTGQNLIVNGDFSLGNTGFVSDYQFSSSGIQPAVYFVGTNSNAWHPAMPPCTDHTGGGNMLMVNGSDKDGVKVWSQTIQVEPNTNYAFSTWLQNITTINPASLQFAINGTSLGNVFLASNNSCVWDRFYTVWNSGNNTTAAISIINRNQGFSGNDFALDDISFAQVFLKRDSVNITVENPIVRTTKDTSSCEGRELQILATGAFTYSWSPTAGLSNPNIANPTASPLVSTNYVVTGTTIGGCIAKDTVAISILSRPTITITSDTIICKNSSIRLNASGASSYSWAPATELDNAFIPNPLASPSSATTYYLTAVGDNLCVTTDSVKINFWPNSSFSINASKSICLNDTVQLQATGGAKYEWQPAVYLSNSTISNPKASPQATTTYTVAMTDNCNNSETLSTTIAVKDLPHIELNRSNDIDCITPSTQILATGGVQYSWTPNTNIDNANVPNPVVSPHKSTWYQVLATGASGCTVRDSILILTSFVNGGGNFHIPNAFTPNNDGRNDCFSLRHWGEVDSFKLSIYNRWDQLVFQTTSTNGCWDGNFQGKQQPSGVYVYRVSVKSPCTVQVLNKDGHITLIR